MALYHAIYFQNLFKVFIKQLLINGVNKKFIPFWIDAAEDIDNDPYTSDCGEDTSITNPHAYTEFEIVNGDLVSFVCIEKPPGKSEFVIALKISN